MWFYCWRGLWSLVRQLWMNAMDTKIYVVEAAGA
jgi:hypothetical protein